MKKENRKETRREAIEVLQAPRILEDESLASITGGCDDMPVTCVCGISPEFET